MKTPTAAESLPKILYLDHRYAVLHNYRRLNPGFQALEFYAADTDLALNLLREREMNIMVLPLALEHVQLAEFLQQARKIRPAIRVVVALERLSKVNFLELLNDLRISFAFELKTAKTTLAEVLQQAASEALVDLDYKNQQKAKLETYRELAGIDELTGA